MPGSGQYGKRCLSAFPGEEWRYEKEVMGHEE
jgi:hypothetical protein